MTKIRKKIILAILTLMIVTFGFLCYSAVNVKADEPIEMDGVSLKLSTTENNEYGLRYQATIPVSMYSEEAEYGVEILPEDLKGDENQIRKVIGTTTEKGTEYKLTADLLNIKAGNTSRPFTARAYKDDNGVVTYSEWSEPKSIFTLATQALADKVAELSAQDVEFLQGVVKTVLGIDSGLEGKYVLKSADYIDEFGNPTDLSTLANGDTFTVDISLEKEGEEDKVIKAYPIITAIDKDGEVIDGALVPVENTQDTYTLVKTVSEFKLDFSLAGISIGTSETLTTLDKDGYYRINFAPGHDKAVNPTWGETGTIRGQGYVSDLGNYAHVYDILGEYGVGYEFTMKFTGNNMPLIMMFANNTNANLSCGVAAPAEPINKGYVITNGINMQMAYSKEPFMYSKDILNVRGPGRINSNIGSAADNKPIATSSPLTTLEGAFGAFDDNKDYKFVIGTKEVNSKVVMYVEIYDITSTEAVVYKGEMDLEKSKAEVEALGKNVLLMAGVRGKDVRTAFAYKSEPELKYPENIVIADVVVVDNKDGSYSVKMKPGHVNSQGATWGVTGTIRGQGYVSDLDNYTHNFVSLGEYGVGYEFVSEFKGNNMPMIMMFANDTTGNLSRGVVYPTAATNHGYVITNGIQMQMSANAASFMYSKDVLTARGPDRIDYHIGYSATNLPEVANGTFTTLEGTFGAFDQNKEYKYVIGTKEVDGIVVMYVEIYDITSTETVVYKGEMDLGKTKAEVEALGKNVLLMAGVRGEDIGTEFKYYTPELKNPENIVIADVVVVDNKDGSYSVTLKPGHVNTSGATWGVTGTIRGQGYVSDLDNYTHNFVSLGEYGVGYEFVSEFKGNNMPMIMMFANDTTGNLSRGVGLPTAATNHGYVITNGIQMQMSANAASFMYSKDVLTARGPDRIDYHIGYSATNLPEVANGTFTTLEGAFGAFDQNKEYKYVIGTKEVDSIVVMYVEIYDITSTEAVVYKGEMNLGKSKAEVEALGKNVLLMAGVRGEGVKTVFTYYTPTKNN